MTNLTLRQIPITESAILDNNPLAIVTRNKQGEWEEQLNRHNAVAPEILFISQAVKWLKPGGRMGIVLPNGVLGNPGDEPIRRWIFATAGCWPALRVPVKAFIVEAER